MNFNINGGKHVFVLFRAQFHEAEELKTTYFQGKRQEFVGEWMERNNLPKLKPVFEGLF